MKNGDLIRGAIAGALIVVVGVLWFEVRELREWQGYFDDHQHITEGYTMPHDHDWHGSLKDGEDLDIVFSKFIGLVKELKQLEADMPPVNLED